MLGTGATPHRGASRPTDGAPSAGASGGAAGAGTTEPCAAEGATPGEVAPRVLTQATPATTAALAPAISQGKRRAGDEGAFERGMARVAGSSTTAGGLEDAGPSTSLAASGGTLAIRRVHSTRSSRAANVRVIGAPPAGVAGVIGVIGGVTGVWSAGRLDSSACGEAAGVNGPLLLPGSQAAELRWWRRARRTRAPSRLATSPLSNCRENSRSFRAKVSASCGRSAAFNATACATISAIDSSAGCPSASDGGGSWRAAALASKEPRRNGG